MKASDLFIQCLENEGVEYIFTVPGEETLDLMESIRTSSIKLMVLRHEQVAGFMAATYGRLTGKPGVCLVTLGPGATNLMTAVAHAQLGQMPMVAITGQKPIKSHLQGKFQVVDVVTMMRPLTKKSATIVDPRNLPALVRESFHLAQEGSAGVVHLELPEDIAADHCPSKVPFPVRPFHPTYANEKAIKEAAKEIKAAKHPLLMLGAGANQPSIAKALRHFIKKISLPFFSTQMGKGVLDEWHPLSLGSAALSEGDFIHCAIEHADLILNVGHDIVEKPPFCMSHQGARVIHISGHPAEINETYFPHLEVVGEIPHTLQALGNQIGHLDRCHLAHYQTIKAAFESHCKAITQGDHFPMTPPRLVQEVQKVVPKEGILAFDNGMYKVWFARNYRAHAPHTILLDNALATMGAGISVAMAAKLVYPERKVVAICGDGGFLMNSNALESAVSLGLNMVILLLRDNGYGMIQWKQEQMDLPNFGVAFNNPDFVQYAAAYGAFGIRITHTNELSLVLGDCLAKEGIHLIEVPIDYSQNSTMLGSQLKEYTRKL